MSLHSFDQLEAPATVVRADNQPIPRWFVFGVSITLAIVTLLMPLILAVLLGTFGWAWSTHASLVTLKNDVANFAKQLETTSTMVVHTREEQVRRTQNVAKVEELSAEVAALDQRVRQLEMNMIDAGGLSSTRAKF